MANSPSSFQRCCFTLTVLFLFIWLLNVIFDSNTSNNNEDDAWKTPLFIFFICAFKCCVFGSLGSSNASGAEQPLLASGDEPRIDTRSERSQPDLESGQSGPPPQG